MEGGDLDLTLQTGGDASAGAATVTNFALRDEPAFRRLVAAAPAGPREVVDPTLVRFQKMTIVFVRSPGTIDIKDAIIYNSNMGLTTSGSIDFAGGAIDLSGTFVPAYSVNTILTKIPLVGVLLGGGQNEGVFGITYRVQGALSRPEVIRQSALRDRAGHFAQDRGRDGRNRRTRRRAGPSGRFAGQGRAALGRNEFETNCLNRRPDLLVTAA